MFFLNLDQLLDELGYAQSQNYRATSEPSQEPLTEHLFRAAKKAGVQGAYLFQTSPPEQKILPPRPAVYVAEAKTRNEAREIHQRLWNLGNAPFIIILLPNEIRVYTGFDFSLANEKQGLVKEIKEVIDLTFASLRDQLADFKADSIDSGKIWETQSQYITPEKRVDTHLLNNLKELEKHLKDREPDLSIIHALIGKYVYIRYLYDRKILSEEWLVENNINLDFVLGRNATLAGLLRLTEVLENRFNGAIFPLPSNIEETLSDEIVSLVASTFKGDDPISGQLHLDFEAYDFSYIPVETLSSIYEQFLHSQGAGKKVGAVYTPEPVADYLLCELEESKPLQSGMKILDPCCGSGIFLVLAYRRLIELKLAQSSNNELKPTELRKILESLYGVERNREACYVAGFSLILTLLNYINPPDLHRNKQFKFPSLHNTQIFECDFFDDESDFWKQDKKFDWIVGNPPWIELNKTIQGEDFARKWILNNTKSYPVGGNRVCEAFTWRVIDLLNAGGCVGLLVHATSLFNQESQKYRKSFFENHAVVRITNFSNLAYVLFGGRGQEPAATIIYYQAGSKVEKPKIVHYAPLIVNQITNRSWESSKSQSTWTITLNEDEISMISPEDVKTGEFLVWKTALWGRFRDKRIVNRLQKIFPITLQELVERRNWNFHTGLKIRTQDSKEDIEPAPYLAGWKQVDIHTKFDAHEMSRTQFRFIVPEQSLNLIPDNSLFISKGRGLPFVVAQKPHMVLSIIDGKIYCAYSDIDFVISEPQIGISANEQDINYLRAVSILLNSSVIQYFLFFNSSSWGVGRSKLYAKDLRKVSLPELSLEQVEELAQIGKRLAYLEEFTDTPDASLQRLLDDAVENLLLIPQNIAIVAREFIAITLQLDKGKSVVPATAHPSEEDLHKYGLHLRDELDTFTEGSELRHKVGLTHSKHLIVCSVEFVRSDISTSIDVTVDKAQGDLSLLLNDIQEKAKQRFSQWVYVQRSLRIFEDSRLYICKSPRLIDWTRTQALNDSDDIIAEILAVNRGLHEVVR